MKQRPKILILLFALLLLSTASFSQIVHGEEKPEESAPDYCENFKEGILGNWNEQNADISINNPGPSGGMDDNFLQAVDEHNETFIYNNFDFDGDWTALGSCFSFDARYIYKETPSDAVEVRLRIFKGSLEAEFAFNIGLTIPMGWVNLSAPIETCTGSVLPSNGFGQWEIVSGSNNCSTWNSIITGVTRIEVQFDDGAGQGEVVGFDNFCFGDCIYEGAYCCDSTPNLIINGNFEQGNTGFTSDYTYEGSYSANSINPGEYGVGSAAEALSVSPNWVLEDPSSCAGIANDNVLLINGRTQQPGTPGTPHWQQSGNVVWRQTVSGLTPGADYTFCGRFKNLAQCAFDVLPNVYVQIITPGTEEILPTIINTSASACDWQELSLTFTNGFVSNSVDIIIFVDHLGNGDGNDLAIDDLALHELEPVDFGAGVFPTSPPAGTPPGIEGHFGDYGPQDDGDFDASCEYLWTVTHIASGFSVSGNAAGNTFSSDPWLLTTTFPPLTFQEGEDYLVELALFNCDCKADASKDFRVTINPSGQIRVVEIVDGQEHPVDESAQKMQTNQSLQFFPNPTTGILKAQIGNQLTDLELVDLNGRVMKKWTISENTDLDISEFAKGIYYLRYNTDGNSGATKVVLQ